MRSYPVWHVADDAPYDSVYEALLRSRQLTADDLATNPDGLHSPQLMAGMDEAVERIVQAVNGGQRIIVYGDYDVDGVTSTTLMLDFLERVGADCGHILPNRFSDGYGVRAAGIQRALAAGAALLITVDNGISAHESLALARREGLDVVVIDHHQQVGDLPPAHSVINPNRKDCSYPFKGLAAVGVTFKVVQAASNRFMSGDERRRYLNELLDLVALGTVADLAPVFDENRILIKRGIKALEQTERIGLRCLKKAAKCNRGPLKTGAIGFYLGPRLNSAGRLASPDLALDLLRCADAAQGAELSDELERLNGRRRQLQRDGAKEAISTVSESDLESDRLLVVLGEDWHLGVIGLIAGSLAELHARPAVICTGAKRDGTYVGSARSIEAYDIVEGIDACSDYLETYGGHPAAAGFSLKAERFEEFRACLIDHANARLTAKDLEPELRIDLLLRPEDITPATVNEMSRLEPFGKGHEPPLFTATDLQIASCKRVGQKGEHLKLALRTGSRSTNAMWWRQGELASELAVGDVVSAAFELETDTFAGFDAAQMLIRDLYVTSGSHPETPEGELPLAVRDTASDAAVTTGR
jgi:single-stranded-DNA-specific exonuclease